MTQLIDEGTILTAASAAERFVDLLTGSLDANLAFRTFPDHKSCKARAQKFNGSLRSLSDTLSDQQNEGCGVFVVVNGGGNCDADITEVRAAFVDADGVRLAGIKWHVPPHMIVKRDDEHWHAYWLVRDLSIHEFTPIQKRLASYYGTDPSVHNLSRVMRLPGSIHQKDPAHPVSMSLIDFTGGAVGDQYRAWNYHTVESVTAGLPELLEARAPRRDAAFSGLPISVEKFREMLSFIDPTMKGEHGKWAGMTLAIIHRQIPLLNSDQVDWTGLADDWNSGALWRLRTKDDTFEVSTYLDREEMLRSAAGKAREAGPVITLGTFYMMAKEGGYQGPPVDEMAAFDALNENSTSKVSPEFSRDLFPAFFVNELDTLPDPRWLIEDLVPEDALCIMYGATGSLKTFVALDVVLSGSSKSTWAEGGEAQPTKLCGFKIPRPLRAAFIAGEGARGLRKRIRAWQLKHGMMSKDIPVAVIPTLPSFADPKSVEKLIRTIRAKLGAVDIVVVDTVMRASSGFNLNVPADSQTFIDACERIRLELGGSVLLIHHTGKDRDKGLLGAENLKAAVHMVERIDLVDSSPGSRTISISQEKAKDSDLRGPIYMEAKLLEIGVNAEGKEVSSLVLCRREAPAPVKANMDGVRLQAALAIIRDGNNGEGFLMRPLAEAMAKGVAGGASLEGEALERRTEVMRQWLKDEIKPGGRLCRFASRTGQGKKAAWRFRDPLFAGVGQAAE